MKKISLLLFVLVIQGFVLAQKPNITSLSKTSLKAGDTLVVAGTSFGTIKENIILDFNGINGRVLSVTNSELKVEVPRGAFSGRINIIKDGLISTSKQFVTIGSVGTDTLLVDADFDKVYNTGFKISKVLDINNDQKLDIISSDKGVWLNTNTTEDFSIINFSQLTNSSFQYYNDIDNDGDVDGINVFFSSVRKNTSTCMDKDFQTGFCYTYRGDYLLIHTIELTKFDSNTNTFEANSSVHKDTITWLQNVLAQYNAQIAKYEVKFSDLNSDGKKEVLIYTDAKITQSPDSYRLCIDVFTFDNDVFDHTNELMVYNQQINSSYSHKFRGLTFDIEDITKDGIPEIIIYSTTGSTSYTYYETDVFTLQSNTYPKYDWSLFQTKSTDAPQYFNIRLDYNLDGDVDYVSNHFGLYKNEFIAGLPSDNSNLKLVSQRTSITNILQDLNGDFLFDEVYAKGLIDSYSLKLLNPDLTSTLSNINHTGYGKIEELVSADLDQNGKNDILMTTSTVGTVAFLNNFESAVIIKKPVVSSISNSFAKHGDEIILVGNDLHTVSDVQIGDNVESLNLIKLSADTIILNAGTMSGELTLVYPKGNILSGVNLNIGKSPVIDTATTFISDGDSIHIKGMNFIQEKFSLKIYFNDIAIQSISSVVNKVDNTVIDESISFKYQSSYGNGYVSVVNELDSVVTSFEIKELVVPKINADNYSVVPLDTFVLLGSDFQTLLNIKVDGLKADIISATDDKIVLIIPSNVTNGELVIETQGGTDNITLSVLKLPVVRSVRSLDVIALDTIFVSGLNFLNSTVKVGTEIVVPIALTDTSFQIIVPQNGFNENLTITNDVGFVSGGRITTKKRPVIFAFEKDSLNIGDTITIKGIDLDAAEFVVIGNDTIKTFLDQNSDSLIFIVSQGATSGEMIVGNSAGGSSLEKKIIVKIGKFAPVIDSVTPNPAVKDEWVYIYGSNLKNINRVFFDDFDVEFYEMENYIYFLVPTEAVGADIVLESNYGDVLFNDLELLGTPKLDDTEYGTFQFNKDIVLSGAYIKEVDSITINDKLKVLGSDFYTTNSGESLTIVANENYYGTQNIKLYKGGTLTSTIDVNVKYPYKVEVKIPSTTSENNGIIEVKMIDLKSSWYWFDIEVYARKVNYKVDVDDSDSVKTISFSGVTDSIKKFSLKDFFNYYTDEIEIIITVSTDDINSDYEVIRTGSQIQKFEQNEFSLPIPVFGKKSTDYRLYSFPFVNSNGLTRDYVFDEFKDKDYDSTFWRLVEYNSQLTDTINDLTEGTDELILGKGYLMAIAKDTAVNIGGDKYATFLNEPIKITLNPGWNLVGNPFPFIIDWGLQISFNDMSNYYSSDFVAIEDGRYVYKSSTDIYEGLFVNLKDFVSKEFTIYPVDLTASFRLEEEITDINSDKYELCLKVRSDNCNTQSAYIGVHPEAKSTYDRFDTPILPVLWESSKIDFGITTSQGKSIMKSTVNSNEEKIWGFTVSTCDNDFGTLEWNKMEGSKTLILEDLSTGYKVDMSLVNEFNFSGTRRFKIVESESMIDLENLEIILTPTLVRDQLLIQSNQNLENGYVVIIDALGRETHFAIDAYSTLLRLTEFPSGIYRVEIRTNTLNQTLYGQKVIIE